MKAVRALAACGAFFVALPVAQASRQVTLEIMVCPEWTEPTIMHLVQLELGTVGGGESDAGSARVRISCDERQISLSATEPSSSRSLSRTLELDRTTPEAARVVAISIAQLVRALDWLPEAREEPPASLPARSPPAERKPNERASRGIELELAAGSRVRELPAALVTQRVGVASAFAVAEELRVGGGVSYERGNTARRGGRVDVQLLGAGVHADLEPWSTAHWSCLVQLRLALEHLTLRGVAASPNIEASRTRGFGAGAEVALGPKLRWKTLGVALLAQAGGDYFAGEARVTGDRPVSLDGVWAGGQLSLLWSP